MKYKNKWTRCKQKHNHQSKWEAECCDRLEKMRKKKLIHSYNLQVPFDLLGKNGTLIARHFVDFLITTSQATQEAWEAKGVKTSTWIIKKKLFEDNYPDIAYRVLTRRGIWP